MGICAYFFLDLAVAFRVMVLFPALFAQVALQSCTIKGLLGVEAFAPKGAQRLRKRFQRLRQFIASAAYFS